MDIVEVVLRPNFESQDHYEILGCPRTADADELERAYRDLSRKYHPENRPDDDEAPAIFVKLGVAYASLTNNSPGGSGLETCDDDEESQSRVSQRQIRTAGEAKAAYENKFGKYRKLYFTEGGVLGIPYAYQLREQRAKLEPLLSATSCGSKQSCRIGFYQPRILKMNLDLSWALLELVLTGATIGALVLSFAVDENNEWIPFTIDESYASYIEVVGGVALLLSFCLLHFWYGFTRYALFWETNAFSSPRGLESEQRDMDEIRDFFSKALHGDDERRSQIGSLVACLPFLLIDQIISSLCILVVSIVMYPIQWALGMSEDTRHFLSGAAKSTGALFSSIAYYIVWLYGEEISRAAVVGTLLINQAFFGSLLYRMDFIEFFFSLVSCGVFVASVPAIRSKRSKAEDKDTDDESKDVTSLSQGETHPFDGEQQMLAETTKSHRASNIGVKLVDEDSECQQDDETDVEVPSFYGFDADNNTVPSNDLRLRHVPSSHSYLDDGQLVNRKSTQNRSSRAMRIDFTGQIVGQDDQTETDENSRTEDQDEGSFVSKMYSIIQQTMEEGFFPTETRKDRDPDIYKFGTASTVDADISDTNLDDDGDMERMTILRPLHEDDAHPPVLSGTPHFLSHNGSIVSIYPSYDDAESPQKSGVIAATTDEDVEKEMDPPHVEFLPKQVMMVDPVWSMLSCPTITSTETPPEDESRQRSHSRRHPTRAQRKAFVSKIIKENEQLKQVPSQVGGMFGHSRSIDDEEVTLVGHFDRETSIVGVEGTDDRSPRRYRRPAPGKVDRSAEEEESLRRTSIHPSMSTDRCDQFVF